MEDKTKITESCFLSELEIVCCEEDGNWKLVNPLLYQSVIFNGVTTAPQNFKTDFASVPRVPIAYMLFGDRAHREAVIHDFLYQTHLVKKHTADRIFLEAMKLRKKPFYVRWPMYWGVILGGRSAYNTGLERFKKNNGKG